MENEILQLYDMFTTYGQAVFRAFAYVRVCVSVCLVSSILQTIHQGRVLNDCFTGYFVLSIISILAMTFTTACLLALPKIYVLFRVKGGRETGGSTMTGTGSEFSTDFKPEATEFS